MLNGTFDIICDHIKRYSDINISCHGNKCKTTIDENRRLNLGFSSKCIIFLHVTCNHLPNFLLVGD